MREDVLVQAGDEVELGGGERETRLLQLDGDGHLTRAGVHREMGNLDRRKASITNGERTLLEQLLSYGKRVKEVETCLREHKEVLTK